MKFHRGRSVHDDATVRGWLKEADPNLSEKEISDILEKERSAEIYLSDDGKYQVNLYRNQPSGFGMPITWLSIKRRDREVIHDWRDLQEIKNALVGPECDAIELYPAESRLVDTANQYHLWCFPEGVRIPIGWTTRAVSEKPIGLSKQRPLPARHAEEDTCKTSNNMGIELLREAVGYSAIIWLLDRDLQILTAYKHVTGKTAEDAVKRAIYVAELHQLPGTGTLHAVKGSYVLPDSGEISVSEVLLAWGDTTEAEVRAQNTI